MKLKKQSSAALLETVDDLRLTAPLVQGMVNATPIGMQDHPGMLFDIRLLTSSHWVSDIIYFPLHTALFNAAKARGCRVQNGAGMAVYQAVRAFPLFTGHRADAKRMQASFEALGR